MSCVNLETILDTECIGASLPKINGNFAALSGGLCELTSDVSDLSANPINTQNTDTVNLNWNSSTRTLRADTTSTFSFRNKITNGNFDIWQRGTVTTASNDNSHVGFYGADRWGFSPNLTGTVSTRLSSFDVTQTQVPNNPNNYLSFNTTVASTGTPLLYQRIENVRISSGKTVTLSFYAKSDTSLSVSIGYAYWYGLPAAVGGSFSDQTDISAGTITTTTNWTKYTITTTLPSIASGLTIDTPENTFLQLAFAFPTGATYVFDIAQVQLEEGLTATPFEHRPIGTELSLCQRYYQYENSRYHSFPAGPYSEASHDIRIFPMRILPTTTIIINDSASLGLFGTPLFGGQSPEKLSFIADHDPASGTVAGYVVYSWTADAEL